MPTKRKLYRSLLVVAFAQIFQNVFSYYCSCFVIKLALQFTKKLSNLLVIYFNITLVFQTICVSQFANQMLQLGFENFE